jgi:hexosaminidase
MIFPRMAALSEVLWSPKGKRNLADFEKRLPAQLKRYESWQVNYSKAYYDLQTAVLPAENNDAVLWKLETKFKDSKIVYEGTGLSAVMEYDSPVVITQPGIYTASLYSEIEYPVSLVRNFISIKQLVKNWLWQNSHPKVIRVMVHLHW